MRAGGTNGTGGIYRATYTGGVYSGTLVASFDALNGDAHADILDVMAAAIDRYCMPALNETRTQFFNTGLEAAVAGRNTACPDHGNPHCPSTLTVVPVLLARWRNLPVTPMQTIVMGCTSVKLNGTPSVNGDSSCTIHHPCPRPATRLYF